MFKLKSITRLPLSKLLSIVLPLFMLHHAYATIGCSEFLDRFGSWKKVEINEFTGFPKRNDEYIALPGKKVAILLKDPLNPKKAEFIEGVLLRIPIWGVEKRNSYDIRLPSGKIRKIDNLLAVAEIRVYLNSSDVTLKSYRQKYSKWNPVKLNDFGLPREEAELVNQRAAFFLEDQLSFNQKEVVEGIVLRVPVWGNNKRATYDVQLADGSTKKIATFHAIKEIRVDESQ